MASDTGVSRPPNSAATFSRCTSSRAAIAPLAGIALVVAHEQLDLLAEQAALGVDLVDGDGEAAHDRLAGLGGLAGHGGDQAELDGLLGGRGAGYEEGRGGGAGEERAACQAADRHQRHGMGGPFRNRRGRS